MLILGYPRRLAVNQKEVKEVRTVAERLVTESGIPAEFPEETKRGVFLSLLLGVVSIIPRFVSSGNSAGMPLSVTSRSATVRTSFTSF